MARKNRSNHRVEQGLPKLRGYTQQAEVAPDPTKPPPSTESPRIAPDVGAVDAVETPGAVPRNKRTWPLTPPSKPPPSSGKQPPLRPMAPPPDKAHRTEAEGPRTEGRPGQRGEKQHSRATDPTQCYWGWPRTPCSTPSVPTKRFCSEHFREYREQRRGWGV